MLAFLAALSAPLLVQRFGRGGASVLSLVGEGASLLVLGLARQPGLVAVAYAVPGSLNTVYAAAFAVYSQEAVTPEWRPLLSGATTAAMGIGGAVTDFGGGALIGRLGCQALFGLGVCFKLASAALVAVSERLRRREPLPCRRS